MRTAKRILLACTAMAAVASSARAADLPVMTPTWAPPTVPACSGVQEFRDTDCSLTWYGITLYGAYDVGVGWVSHGEPNNGYNYEGESLVNRNGNHAQWLIAPNNLQQSGLGLKGKEEIWDGWSAVFNASTGINPQSGQLANAQATDVINIGLPRDAYSATIDGPRGGQFFNDEIYGGISSSSWFGTLTFGRQRPLGIDAVLAYDPAGGSNDFSFIGYNALTGGGGDTEDGRWDNAIKYRVNWGLVHFGAMYKFAYGSGGCYSASTTWTAKTCTPEQPHDTAYGLDFGGEYGNFAGDIVFQHYNQAISVVEPLQGPQSPTQPLQSTTDYINSNPITGANLVGTTNALWGIVTDNTALMLAAKYTWNVLKFFGGYEYIHMVNPGDPLGVGATAQGDYILSSVEDNNLDSPKINQVAWAGVKYALNSQTDLTWSYYHEWQNNYRVPSTCSPTAGFRSSCAGTLDEVSFYADYHFTKRADIFAGISYSWVTGGLAIAIPHGPGVPYFANNNLAPVAGVRFTF